MRKFILTEEDLKVGFIYLASLDGTPVNLHTGKALEEFPQSVIGVCDTCTHCKFKIKPTLSGFYGSKSEPVYTCKKGHFKKVKLHNMAKVHKCMDAKIKPPYV